MKSEGMSDNVDVATLRQVGALLSYRRQGVTYAAEGMSSTMLARHKPLDRPQHNSSSQVCQLLVPRLQHLRANCQTQYMSDFAARSNLVSFHCSECLDGSGFWWRCL